MARVNITFVSSKPREELFILESNAATVKNDLKAYRNIEGKIARMELIGMGGREKRERVWINVLMQNETFPLSLHRRESHHFYHQKIEKSVAFHPADAAIPSVYSFINQYHHHEHTEKLKI